MACMEHDCRDCGHMWFDNEPDGDCPECGSPSVAHFCDEQDDNEIEIEPDDEEEDEDDFGVDHEWEEIGDDEVEYD